MKTAVPFLFFLAHFFLATMPSSANDLSDLRWKRRVVVIYAPAGTEKQLAEQQQLFDAHASGLSERDVTRILLRKSADHGKIAPRFKLSGKKFAVLLLGKDGGEKFRSSEVVPPETLFRLIDSMPMRREEMRQRE